MKHLFVKLIKMLSFLLIFLGCDEGNSPSGPEDNTKPTISIKNPTTYFSYLSDESEITISGNASDNMGVLSVEWSTNQGYSGNASGTTSWTANNIPLSGGDNKITVTAIDDAGNSQSNDILVTYNEYLSFLGSPQINPNGFYANTSTDVIVRVSILPNSNLIESSVKVIEVDENGNLIQELGQLYDDGDLNHGDDIQSDGIYSGIINIYENYATNIFMRIEATTQENIGDVEAFTQISTVSVIEEIPGYVADEAVNTQESAELIYDDYAQTHTHQEAIDYTIEHLEQQSNVVNATTTASGDIWIDYESGLTGMIIYYDEGIKGNASNQSYNSERVPDRIATSHQTIGKTNYLNLSKTNTNDNENGILDKDVLLYAPRYSEFSGWWIFDVDVTEDINTMLTDSDYPPFDITYLKDSDADVNALTLLTQFGLIVIDTHGNRNNNGDVVFLTGEVFNNQNYQLEWHLNQLTIATHDGATYWVVQPSFISNISGSFPNSIIFASFCHSADGSSMADVFINKGANAYFGFDATVQGSFTKEMANDLFHQLINEHTNTGEAFIPNQNDSSNPPAEFVMLGNEPQRSNTYFEVGLVNGGFEEGNLTGWSTEGDGRVITQLGNISPYENDFMGIISTGLGFTEATGSISQSFFVNTGVTTLSLKWNFLSEEFMEFVGSQYQDYFEIKLIEENGNEYTIFYKSIDDIADEYNLTEVSPDVVFDQGDVYGTGWQSFIYDISQSSGSGVTLILGAGDVGDSIFDTAILLDKIEIE